MSSHTEFRQAALADPGNRTPLLVYADWLQSQRNPAAEIVRLECALDGRTLQDDQAARLYQAQQEIRALAQPEDLRPADELLAHLDRTGWETCWNGPGGGGSEDSLRRARRHGRNIMRRVRYNCQYLAERYRGESYLFEPLRPQGWEPPSAQLQEEVENVDAVLRHGLPLSLRLFFEEVGIVDFRGTHPQWGFEAYAGDGIPPEVVFRHTDPLFVRPIPQGLPWDEDDHHWDEGPYEDDQDAQDQDAQDQDAQDQDAQDQDAQDQDDQQQASQHMHVPVGPYEVVFAPFAPTKTNVGSGGSILIRCDGPSLDGMLECRGPGGEVLQTVYSGCSFLDYLRMVFHWGGFPGLRDLPRDSLREWLDDVRGDLLPF